MKFYILQVFEFKSLRLHTHYVNFQIKKIFVIVFKELSYFPLPQIWNKQKITIGYKWLSYE